MVDRRLIDANALRDEVEATQPCTCNPAYGRILGPGGEHALECVGKQSLRNGVRHLIDAAPTVAPDDARLRAIIEQRFVDQGFYARDPDSAMLNAIALAVDDIMEYLGAKATE